MNTEGKILGECGPAKYFKAATVMMTHYPHDGSIALVANGGAPDQQVYTVCLWEPPAPIREGHVWLRNWGGAEGAPEALVEAGLVKLTGMTWPTGFVEAQEAELINKSS